MAITGTETLTRYIVTDRKGCALCWRSLPVGTAAFTDPEGFVVCATCALHCATCNDSEHDHPRYVHADAEG
jgi:hypothetical protein